MALQLSASAPPDDGYWLVNPKAIELFEADSSLMQWALARYDSDSDRHLSIFEADKAAAEFKRIADGDGDGRVTLGEYRAARDFIVARYAIAQHASK
jgi:hypothetical protein